MIITFSRGERITEGMTKEASNKQITDLNAVAQAQANHQFTAMGPSDFMARLQLEFTETFSKKRLSEILREALEIVESVDDIDESFRLASTRFQGTSPTKQ
jgi:hypothetical protein